MSELLREAARERGSKKEKMCQQKHRWTSEGPNSHQPRFLGHKSTGFYLLKYISPRYLNQPPLKLKYPYPICGYTANRATSQFLPSR